MFIREAHGTATESASLSAPRFSPFRRTFDRPTTDHQSLNYYLVWLDWAGRFSPEGRSVRGQSSDLGSVAALCWLRPPDHARLSATRG
jgi:hypothetical protein